MTSVGVDTEPKRALPLPAVRVPKVDEIGPTRYALRAAGITLAAAVFVLLANVTVLSRLAYRSAQTRALARLRNDLALGVAPLGQVDSNNHLLRSGTPVALLEIPRLGLRAAVLEGTSGRTLESGPGHLRNTVLPGEAGTSVIYGRAAAYGGSFSALGALREGDEIRVTAGFGPAHFKVIDVRRAGDPGPAPLDAGAARLTLVTATGLPYIPAGLLRVDADSVGKVTTPGPLPVTTVAPRDRALASDTSGLGGLVFILLLLDAAALGAIWAWRHWGKAQTWVVFAPLMLLLSFQLSDQVVRLLPNLM